MSVVSKKFSLSSKACSLMPVLRNELQLRTRVSLVMGNCYPVVVSLVSAFYCFAFDDDRRLGRRRGLEEPPILQWDGPSRVGSSRCIWQSSLVGESVSA